MYIYYTKNTKEKTTDELILSLLSYYCDSCMGPAYECACCRDCGIADQERMPVIKRSENGKPYFEGNNMPFFSVSHTKEYFVFAIAPFKVGVDIEFISKDEKKQKIAKRYFSEREKEYPNFTRLWTRKESLVKYYGDTLFNSLATEVLEDKIKGKTGEDLFFEEIILDGEYLISILKEKDEACILKEVKSS